MNGSIYKLTCKVTGKTYVGQTTRAVQKRVSNHFSLANRGADYPLYRAIRKYGSQSFEITILESGIKTIEELNFAETKWITVYSSFGVKGYNCTTGGEGFTVSEETKQKLSAYKKGRKTSEKHRLAVSAATKGENNSFYGRKHSQKSLEQMKSKLKVLMVGSNNPFFGHAHTEEAKRKNAEAHRGKSMHENTRMGIAKANKGNQYTKGRSLSLEHKLKLSGLTVEKIRYIRKNPDGLSRKALSEKLNVSSNSVRFVQSGRTFKEVI